jgi:uncharacterized protein (DUF58 family)
MRAAPAGHRRRFESFPLPHRALGPVLAAAATFAAWTAVAHNSGSGWVQTLGAILAGFFLVGLVVPGFATRRARVAVAWSPADVTAGQPAIIELTTSGSLRVGPVSPAGPVLLTGAAGRRELRIVPDHRGVLDRVVLDVSSAAPSGLVWWTKHVTLPLAQPLYVAPRMGLGDPEAFVEASQVGDGQRRVRDESGETSGVRPYLPGDNRRSVHWPATAHAGELMVRELEGPRAKPVTVRAELPSDEAAAERVAERALGTVAQVLHTGAPVLLLTNEAAGERSGLVATTGQAGRRLAQAQSPLSAFQVPPPPGEAQ